MHWRGSADRVLRRAWCASLLAAFFVLVPATRALEVSGYVGVQTRVFFHDPQLSNQRTHDASLVAQPEFYFASESGQDSLLFVPYLRIDSSDRQRSHVDVRELFYRHVGEGFDIGVGIGKVFWGVAESRHLVDVINQTDLVDSIDGEEKLGQPMAKVGLDGDFGAVEFFLLTGFRERTYPGARGRLRSEPAVAVEQPHYEAANGDQRLDVAMRYSHAVGPMDFAVAHFHGNSRDPRMLARRTHAGTISLQPYYEVVDQTSVEFQYTVDSWLWKVEALRRAGQGDRAFFAYVAGFEHTRYGLFDSAHDLGILVEHLYDGRASEAGHPFENDLFIGFRWAWNDAESTQILAGAIQDLDGAATLFNLEAERRLGENYRLELNVRSWLGVGDDDPNRPIRRDDHIELSVRRFF